MTVETENPAIDILLNTIFYNYGYDFRNYARTSIARRLRQHQEQQSISSLDELTRRLLSEPAHLGKLLPDLTVNVTEMFRDPSFFSSFKDHVIPIIRRQPVIKIWHAGCSSGQEVYSMAILLAEEGLLDKCRIYGTDSDEHILQQARKGIFPLKDMKTYTENYRKAGGQSSFSDYYKTCRQFAIMAGGLKKNILFSHHNLVSDGVFSQMDVVVCRNVLIYFNEKLQNHALSLFIDSLYSGGILCLGAKETVRFSKYARHFSNLAAEARIFRKKKGFPKKDIEHTRNKHPLAVCSEVKNGINKHSTG